MTTYLIKVILCSAVFFFTYKLLLEKEKMHLFNRFYLLTSLISSFVIPVITFSTKRLLPISENEVLNTNILQDHGIIQNLSTEHSTNYLFSILLTIYVTITTLLLFRFIVNLNKILSKALAQQTIPYKNSK
jgi:bla regulator protein BlaR1